MAGMVGRYRAELMPNGLVSLFDNETKSATLFATCGYRDGGRRVITLHSGPETDKAGWDAAYAAFPDVPDCEAPGSIGCKIRVKHGHDAGWTSLALDEV